MSQTLALAALAANAGLVRFDAFSLATLVQRPKQEEEKKIKDAPGLFHSSSAMLGWSVQGTGARGWAAEAVSRSRGGCILGLVHTHKQCLGYGYTGEGRIASAVMVQVRSR